MVRTQLWPLVGVGFSLGILGFVGCHSQKPDPPASIKGALSASPTQKPSEAKLFSDWDDMVGAIIISGEQIGYLEPCGCTSGQLGGLGRRYDLIDRLRHQRLPLALIDLGSIAEPPGARGGPVESRIKFGIALRALTAMQYDALALSAADLKQGIAETLTQFLNLGEQPRVVAANVVPDQTFESVITPSVRSATGPIKLGITAVLDPDAYQALGNDPDKPSLTVKPPRESLKAVLADLESNTNLQVLMVQGTPEKAKELALAFPGFEVVVSTSEMVDPDADAEMMNEGKTALIQVGKKGKYVGVLGLFQDPKRPYRYRRVTLDRRYNNVEPIKKLLDEELQGELQVLRVVEDYVKRGYIGGADGATFIGAETCKECHPNTYSRWASTKHAQAFQDLLKPERYREFDAECASCHTTGFEYTTGFRSAQLTPYLKGNQCENCHGPGSKHAEEPDNKEFRTLLSKAVANVEQTRFCNRCHDEDNSPHFDLVTYHGKIVHKEMDKYDDPKVHVGIKSKLSGRDG
jgi:Cytochrome c554 and c-prime